MKNGRSSLPTSDPNPLRAGAPWTPPPPPDPTFFHGVAPAPGGSMRVGPRLCTQQVAPDPKCPIEVGPACLPQRPASRRTAHVGTPARRPPYGTPTSRPSANPEFRITFGGTSWSVFPMKNGRSSLPTSDPSLPRSGVPWTPPPRPNFFPRRCPRPRRFRGSDNLSTGGAHVYVPNKWSPPQSVKSKLDQCASPSGRRAVIPSMWVPQPGVPPMVPLPAGRLPALNFGSA